MIYIEYMEHDRSIPAELIKPHKEKSGWADDDVLSENQPLAVLGRTLRLGPHPPFLAIWQCKTFESLQEWESYFKARRGIQRLPRMPFVSARQAVIPKCSQARPSMAGFSISSFSGTMSPTGKRWWPGIFPSVQAGTKTACSTQCCAGWALWAPTRVRLPSGPFPVMPMWSRSYSTASGSKPSASSGQGSTAS